MAVSLDGVQFERRIMCVRYMLLICRSVLFCSVLFCFVLFCFVLFLLCFFCCLFRFFLFYFLVDHIGKCNNIIKDSSPDPTPR